MKILRKLFKPKFEYKILVWSKEYRTFNKPEELNELGKQGWECYTVVQGGQFDTFYLKRRI